MDQQQLRTEIEAAFAKADRTNVRATSKALARLIAQLDDAAVRRRYEGALDILDDMVKKGDGPDAG